MSTVGSVEHGVAPAVGAMCPARMSARPAHIARSPRLKLELGSIPSSVLLSRRFHTARRAQTRPRACVRLCVTCGQSRLYFATSSRDEGNWKSGSSHPVSIHGNWARGLAGLSVFGSGPGSLFKTPWTKIPGGGNGGSGSGAEVGSGNRPGQGPCKATTLGALSPEAGVREELLTLDVGGATSC